MSSPSISSSSLSESDSFITSSVGQDLTISALNYASSSDDDDGCFPFNPQRETTCSVQQTTNEPTTIRVGTTEWCTCGNCVPMPTEEESMCCHELASINQYLENPNECIMTNILCQDICLNEERVFHSYRMLGTITRRPSNNMYHRQLRKVAYRGFTCLVHGYLGPRNRRPIPSCVVSSIRQRFPDPDGLYMGYIPLLDYAAVDMATLL